MSASLDWTKFGNVVNGQLEFTSKTRHSINPANGEPGPEVPIATPEDVDRVFDFATAAFKQWSLVPWDERRRSIEAFVDALEAEKEDFIRTLTKEQGKPVCTRDQFVGLLLKYYL
jgi:acyl-CoA reductase-like NAD-dependent aldehyde dehydrogenase